MIFSNTRALTWSSYGAMFFLGVGMTLVGAIARTVGLEVHQIGLLISIQHLGFALAVVVAGWLSDLIGKPRLLMAGSLLLAISFFTLFGSYHLWVNLALMFLNGVGIGTYEGVADAWLVDLHTERQSRYVNINHFFVTIGSVCITLYLIFMVGDWRLSIWTAGIFVTALAAFFANAENVRKAGSTAALLKRLRGLEHRGLLCILFCIATLAVGVQLGTMGYLTTYLVQIRGFEQTASSWGLLLFLVGVAAGRLVIGFLVKEELVLVYLALLFILSSAALAALFLFDLGSVTLLVVFLCGASVSAMFPLVIALVAKFAPEASGTAIALLKLTVPLGGMVIAFIVARASRVLPLESALLAVPCASLLGLLGVVWVGATLRARASSMVRCSLASPGRFTK